MPLRFAQWEETGLAKLATEHFPVGLWETQIFEERLRSTDLSPLETDKQPGIHGIYKLFILQIFASVPVCARPYAT